MMEEEEEEEVYKKIEKIFEKEYCAHYWTTRNWFIINGIFPGTSFSHDIESDGYTQYFRAEPDIQQYSQSIKRQVNNYIQALNRQYQHI